MTANALDTCNACDAIGVDPNSPAGYCTTCEQITRLEIPQEDNTMTTMLHVKGHAKSWTLEVGPRNPHAEQVEYQPIRFGYGIDIYIDGPFRYGEVGPITAEVSISSSGAKSVVEATLHADAYTTAVNIAARINELGITGEFDQTDIYEAITGTEFAAEFDVELL